LTKPTVTITNGHGFLSDCNDKTGWTEDPAKTLTATSLTVELDDWFKLTGTASATAKKTYWERNFTDISALTYPSWIVRLKTSEASTGLGAKVEIVYSTGATEILFGATPVFSTLCTVKTGTIVNAGGALWISKIRFYGVSDAACNAKSVYYDFALLHKGVFTFPNTELGKEWIPPPRNVFIEIPSRVTDVTQNLGGKSAKWRCSCNLDIGRLSTTSGTCTGDDWKRPQGVDSEYQTDTVKGEVFDDLSHNSYHEPFQWLNTGMGRQIKAVLDEEPRFREDGDKHTVDLVFKEYSRSNKSNESYVERFGLNIT